ncbi:hypothetical protein JCM10212_007147 [Sporobolomyces blumeae]
MSDESFAAIDAMLNQEVHLVSTLSEENARLRSLLEERDLSLAAVPPVVSVTRAESPSTAILNQLDPTVLLAELHTTRARQEEMARELLELRKSQTAAASAAKEDQSSEVAVLRASLANLASQLEAEKARVNEIESKRKEEEDKVAILRSKVEESRRALMRLQGESTKRASIDASNGGFSFPPRRASFLDTSNRRRSSLGLASISGSPSIEEPPVVGLGLAVDSGSSTPATNAAPKASSATPLARFAHRRGSASMSTLPETFGGDDDRTARLRDLRLGVISTKISSRRNSAVSGVPDFLAPDDFVFNPTNGRRMSAVSRRHRNSICEEEETESNGPPSANLRLLGRRESAAVFEPFSRRSSSSEATFQSSSSSRGYNTEVFEDLRLQVEGLRIQLAESEEGRRASELCLQALKDFISKSDPTANEGLSLPPMPSDPTMDAVENRGKRSSSSASTLPRWSIPRLSLSRRESSNSNSSASSSPPNQRRTSASSAVSTTTLAHVDRSTPSLPSFGSFSFSALVNRSTNVPVRGDASPTAPECCVLPASPLDNTFPVDPSPLVPSDHEHDDAESTAPSLVSDMSSRASVSPCSSRAASPSPRNSDVGLAIAASDDGHLALDSAHLHLDLGKAPVASLAPLTPTV